MSLAKLTLLRVAVPLKKVIRHASFERSVSENLIVQASLKDGSVGYGEGVPRPYVTGETVETAFRLLERHDWARAIGSPRDFPELVARLRDLQIAEIEDDPRGMAGNAARCALELALLDAYGRKFGRSVGDAVEIGAQAGLALHPPSRVRYSGAITSESTRGELVSAVKMRLYGFRHVKIKVGTSGQDDGKRLRRMRKILGSQVDIRVDANESYDAAELIDRARELAVARPSALEQPIPHSQIDSLTDLRPKLGIPIMLDESLCGFPDAVHALEHETADIFNVRLSKCGGILPSLRILAFAARSGLAAQLGCHPGETSLLSAAGRHVACRLPSLLYVEGSYDRHVLARNLTRQDVTFSYGGKALPITGPGLGVDVDPDQLAAMTEETREILYD